MEFKTFLVLTVLALTSMQIVYATPSTGDLRAHGHDSHDSHNSHSDVLPAEVSSISATRAKDELLSAVNAALNATQQIDENQLIDIAKRIVHKDGSLATADAHTKQVVEAIRVAVAKLYPNKKEIDVLLRVLPLIIKRQLAAPTKIDILDITDKNVTTSFTKGDVGTQVMSAVKKIVPSVNVDTLVRVGKMIVSGDSLSKADEATKKISAALTETMTKLFPGEKVVDALKRVLPHLKAL